MWTAQLTDTNLAPPQGTDVRHFKNKEEALAAWLFAYTNSRLACAAVWGGELPAMTDQLTVTLWRGQLTDVTDVYPDAEVVRGRQGGPVWRRIS